MASNLKTRIARIEQSPEVIKAAERQRELREWEDFVNYHRAGLERHIAICEYEGCLDSRAVIANDYIEYEITVMWRLMELYPIEVGQFWEWEVVEPVRYEVYRELMLRWYGFKRTDEEEAEATRLTRRLIDDFEAGLPREQSEAAAIVEQSYAQHPRLNYIYKNLPLIKPEGWEWQL